MQKLYKNFHMFHFKKGIVSKATICGNTVCNCFSKTNHMRLTVPLYRILSVKNVRAWVSLNIT